MYMLPKISVQNYCEFQKQNLMVSQNLQKNDIVAIYYLTNTTEFDFNVVDIITNRLFN